MLQIGELTASSIKQSVSYFDSIVYGVGASSIVNLPQTKANLWHIVTRVELESW